jgi:hypothetical protein
MIQSGNFWIHPHIFMAWYLVKHRDSLTFTYNMSAIKQLTEDKSALEMCSSKEQNSFLK